MNKEPQTFEVAGYSDVDMGVAEAFKVIRQSIEDLERDSPAQSVKVSMTGDLIRITYLTAVVNLPVRRQQTEDEIHEVFKQVLSYLKKEFKDRTGKALKLTEQKELANYSVQKTSLNERYTYCAWRFYKLGGF